MIERTLDYRKVCRLAPWKPMISSENAIYLLDDKVNLWAFERYIDGWMIHAQMSLECRGRKAVESAKRAFKWIADNTGSRNIYAGIPVDKKPACYVASWAGMQYSHTKDNKRFYKKQL